MLSVVISPYVCPSSTEADTANHVHPHASAVVVGLWSTTKVLIGGGLGVLVELSERNTELFTSLSVKLGLWWATNIPGWVEVLT